MICFKIKYRKIPPIYQYKSVFNKVYNDNKDNEIILQIVSVHC